MRVERRTPGPVVVITGLLAIFSLGSMAVDAGLGGFLALAAHAMLCVVPLVLLYKSRSWF